MGIHLVSLQITCTIAFLTYMLSQHPKVLARLREEILHVVGPLRVPQYDDIRGLRYLRAVINGMPIGEYLCPHNVLLLKIKSP
jgi:Cytochrome P450